LKTWWKVCLGCTKVLGFLIRLPELIGEEIYDEYDLRGVHALAASTYLPPEAAAAVRKANTLSASNAHPPMVVGTPLLPPTTSPFIPSASLGGVAGVPATDAKGTATSKKAGGYNVPFLGTIAMPKLLRTSSAQGTPPNSGASPSLEPDTSGEKKVQGSEVANGEEKGLGVGAAAEQNSSHPENPNLLPPPTIARDPLSLNAGAQPSLLVPTDNATAAGHSVPQTQLQSVVIVPGRPPVKTSLTEAVLRGRQRLGVAGAHSRSSSVTGPPPGFGTGAPLGTVTGEEVSPSNSGGVGGVVAQGVTGTLTKPKGRFKSSPIDGNLVVPVRGPGAGGGSKEPTGALNAPSSSGDVGEEAKADGTKRESEERHLNQDS
jgi:hypothetical protein